VKISELTITVKKLIIGATFFQYPIKMDILKIRALGRKIYFEDLQNKCRAELFVARRHLEKADNNVEEARDSVKAIMNRFSYINAILNGEIQEENPDWAMYEIIGHKEKEEADKFYEEWMNRNPMWIPK